MTLARMVIAALLLLVPAAARAQIVQGYVTEDSTDAPVAGVRVELRGEGIAPATTRTDSAGAFRMDLRTRGRYVLRVQHPGYAPVDSVPLEVGSNERVEVSLKMGRRPITLAPIIVRARADQGVHGFRDRVGRNTFGRFITREEMERRPSTRTSDLLRMMPGVRVVPGRAGNNLILMRGGCLATVFVDGMQVRQFADSGVDVFVHPTSLEGVEVYNSPAGAPAIFQTAEGCGVVAFWTKPGEGGRFSWRKLVLGVGLVLGLFLVAAR